MMTWARWNRSVSERSSAAILLLVLTVAIPRPMLAERAPDRGFFGLTPSVVNDAVKIVAVTPGGPAETAGVRAGDVVVLLDGAPPAMTSTGGVGEAFSRYHVGDEVEIVIRRDGAVHTFRITLGSVPPPTREEQARIEAIERREHAAQVVDEMFTTLDYFELTFSKDDRLMFRESADEDWRALEPEVAKTFEAVTRHFLRERKTKVLRLRVERSDGKEPALVVVDP